MNVTGTALQELKREVNEPLGRFKQPVRQAKLIDT